MVRYLTNKDIEAQREEYSLCKWQIENWAYLLLKSTPYNATWGWKLEVMELWNVSEVDSKRISD